MHNIATDEKVPTHSKRLGRELAMEFLFACDSKKEIPIMARKSTRENKNIYQRTRESLDLTREEASELLVTMSPERIEKIRNLFAAF